MLVIELSEIAQFRKLSEVIFLHLSTKALICSSFNLGPDQNLPIEERFNFSIFGVKVHIFWEGHKTLRNLHLFLTDTTYSQKKVEISQNFVAFSDYMNFKLFTKKLIASSERSIPARLSSFSSTQLLTASLIDSMSKDSRPLISKFNAFKLFQFCWQILLTKEILECFMITFVRNNMTQAIRLKPHLMMTLSLLNPDTVIELVYLI